MADRFILVVELSVDMFSCEAYYQDMKLHKVKFPFLTCVYVTQFTNTLTD